MIAALHDAREIRPGVRASDGVAHVATLAAEHGRALLRERLVDGLAGELGTRNGSGLLPLIGTTGRERDDRRQRGEWE